MDASKLVQSFQFSHFFTIIVSLRHSMHHYKPHAPGLWAGISNFCLHCPTKLFMGIVVLAIRLAYGLAMAWEWEISPFKYDSNPAWFYGLGYAPTVLIIVIFNIAGYVDDNEDQVIIRHRRERGRQVDAELGLVKRPNWWSNLNSQRYLSDEARLKAMTTEVGGGRATAKRISDTVELGNMNIPRTTSVTSGAGMIPGIGITPGTGISMSGSGGLRDRSRSRNGDDPYRDHSPANTDDSGEGLRPVLQHRASSVVTDVSNVSGATGLTGRTLTGGEVQPQRIRSMLDI